MTQPIERGQKTERLQIMVDEDELQAIDDWRFAHHMPSRAAAIRELLRRGLLATDVPPAIGEKSEDFSVIPRDIPAPDPLAKATKL